ncbi:unnamed protein product [marine sediment metagenome]|uniref:Uncharacterized protein n=1 Tax=marine sediment metagenome TaxID=412755 RepID=X0ZNH8_9ZZZZ
MKIPIFMIFQFFGVISSWASKALQDGKVTALEGFELLVALAMVLGIPLDFKVDDFFPPGKNEVKIEPVGSDLKLDVIDKVPRP